MTSGQDTMMYLLIQFGGYFLESAPLPFLLYASFADPQLRKDRKKLLLFLEILIITGSLVRVSCTGIDYRGNKYDAVCRWITDGMPALIWLVITAVYAASFCGKVRGRLLNYLITIQYALFTCTVAKTAAVFLQEEFWSLLPYIVCAGIAAPAVCYLLKNHGFHSLKGENPELLRMMTAVSAGLVVLYAIAMAAQAQIAQLAGGWKINILLSVLIVCMILAEVTAYGIFFLCLKIEEEKEHICTQLSAAEVQARLNAKKISEEKRRRHNMRHHFRMLASLLDNHRYDEMEEYLRKYLKECELAAYRPVTSNPMFNAIMSYYMNQADKSGICVRMKIEIQEQYAFEYIDMTVLLGNALENAVKACKSSGAKPPFIYIDMLQVKQQLLIQIENSCKEAAEPPDTDKTGTSKQKTIPGYGIRSMRKIAEKYGGDMEYWKTENTFILRIILHIPDADKFTMEEYEGV